MKNHEPEIKLGFIGLGNMGHGMASNLLKANYKVVAFDIDNKKLQLLTKLGAKKVENPIDIVGLVEIVILCLPHPEISKEVIESLVIKEGKVKTIIDTSTLTPEVAQDIYKDLKKYNINFLCAPMLGGKNAAENKEIHFLVEGDKDIFNKHKTIFTSMGNRVNYLGVSPSATLAKLAYNICRYSNLATGVEVARFLRNYTKDTSPIYDLLSEGSLDNFGQVWKEDIKEMVLKGVPYKPSNIPEKDLTLILQLTENQKLSNKLITAIKEVYKSLAK